jgi:uncharacterized membrane protein YobD (UPF0266 family)
MKKIKLSSSLTFFWKFIFPIVFIVGFIALAIQSIISKELDFLTAFVTVIIVFVLLYFFFLRTKNVYMDDECLCVDNFFRNVKIPFSNIESVSHIIMYPRLIFIKLKEKSEFGKRITFIGYSEFFLFYSTHPAVSKLRSRIKSTE